MDTYKLRDLNATVGMFGDFTNFKDVIDYIFETNPYKKALAIFGCDDCEDLAEALVDDQGYFDESRAKELCMNNLDGINADDDNPKAEHDDEMYDRAAGK